MWLNYYNIFFPPQLFLSQLHLLSNHLTWTHSNNLSDLHKSKHNPSSHHNTPSPLCRQQSTWLSIKLCKRHNTTPLRTKRQHISINCTSSNSKPSTINNMASKLCTNKHTVTHKLILISTSNFGCSKPVGSPTPKAARALIQRQLLVGLNLSTLEKSARSFRHICLGFQFREKRMEA